MSVVDAVVVGAGPAGSLAAARLAALGRSVVLLEAAAFPRDKVCGDVLLPEVEESLARAGCGFEEIASDALLLDGCRYVSASGRRMDGAFRDGRGVLRPWRILPRRKLDARLARYAVACGAELCQRHRLIGLAWRPERGAARLRISTPAGVETLEARLVIGADGAASRVARETGLRPASDRADRRDLYVGMRAYADWPHDDSRLTVIADRRLLPGCSWIVPQPGGRANIGLGMVAADRRARGVRLRRRLEALLGAHTDPATVRHVDGWVLPGGHSGRRTVADGTILVGDAAGLVDPFTGHGIHNAMASGLDAAELGDAAIRAGDTSASGPIGRFERIWRRRLLTEFRLGHLLQRFHARPRLVDLAVARAAVSRRWADRFIGLMGHAVAKSEILRPTFLLDLVRPSGDWPPSRPGDEGRISAVGRGGGPAG